MVQTQTTIKASHLDIDKEGHLIKIHLGDGQGVVVSENSNIQISVEEDDIIARMGDRAKSKRRRKKTV